MRQISRKEYGAAGNTERYGNVLSLGYKGGVSKHCRMGKGIQQR